MKRKMMLLTAVLVSVLFLFACSGAGGGNALPGAESGDYTGGSVEAGGTALSSETRKLIYTVSFTLSCDDLTETLKTIKDNMNADEWATENHYDDSATLTLRIRTPRLDEFIDAVSAPANRYNFSKTVEDISLTYANKELEVATLTAELNKLTELMAASNNMSDIIQLNARIAELNRRLNTLNSDLNLYDSLIEYSTVTIYLRVNYTAPAALSFGQKIANAFTGVGKALTVFFKGLLIALIYVLPFVAVFGGIGAAVAVPLYLKKRKRDNPAPPKDPESPQTPFDDKEE